jgi:hypothetical protein
MCSVVSGGSFEGIASLQQVLRTTLAADCVQQSTERKTCRAILCRCHMISPEEVQDSLASPHNPAPYAEVSVPSLALTCFTLDICAASLLTSYFQRRKARMRPSATHSPTNTLTRTTAEQASVDPGFHQKSAHRSVPSVAMTDLTLDIRVALYPQSQYLYLQVPCKYKTGRS